MRAPLSFARAQNRALLFPARLALLGLLLWLPIGQSRVSAQAAAAPVQASVLIVLGSNQGTGTDAALSKLEALRKPPFDGFSKKVLLKRADVSLTQGSEVEVELPNGRKLRLALLGRAPDGRFRVSVSINRPGKQDYLPVMTVIAAPGDPFFVAGQKHEGGTLIIGVSVGKVG